MKCKVPNMGPHSTLLFDTFYMFSFSEGLLTRDCSLWGCGSLSDRGTWNLSVSLQKDQGGGVWANLGSGLFFEKALTDYPKRSLPLFTPLKAALGIFSFVVVVAICASIVNKCIHCRGFSPVSCTQRWYLYIEERWVDEVACIRCK